VYVASDDPSVTLLGAPSTVDPSTTSTLSVVPDADREARKLTRMSEICWVFAGKSLRSNSAASLVGDEDSVWMESESGLPEVMSSSIRLLHRVPDDPQSVFGLVEISQPVASLLRSALGTMRVVAAEAPWLKLRYETRPAVTARMAATMRMRLRRLWCAFCCRVRVFVMRSPSVLGRR
jgi:hypothetical protein